MYKLSFTSPCLLPLTLFLFYLSKVWYTALLVLIAQNDGYLPRFFKAKLSFNGQTTILIRSFLTTILMRIIVPKALRLIFLTEI